MRMYVELTQQVIAGRGFIFIKYPVLNLTQHEAWLNSDNDARAVFDWLKHAPEGYRDKLPPNAIIARIGRKHIVNDAMPDDYLVYIEFSVED